MKCYKVKVETTSPLAGTFKMGDKYFPCVGGEVFVFAEHITGAAQQVPCAKAIEEVGIAHNGSSVQPTPQPQPVA